MTPETSMAYQHHCVSCHREQYAPAVIDVSEGKHPCVWCGHMSTRMTVDEYRDAMRAEVRK